MSMLFQYVRLASSQSGVMYLGGNVVNEKNDIEDLEGKMLPSDK